MAKCEFCGNDAGLLRNRHRECEQRHEQGVESILAEGRLAALSPQEIDEFSARSNEIAGRSFIDPGQLRYLRANAWEVAVADALEDDVLSEDEESALVAYRDHFSFSQRDLNNAGTYTKLVKAGVIRDVLEDKLPQRASVQGDMPFNFQKGEHLVWLCNDVEYHEERERTKYVGGHSGASIRIAKGVYYRVGGFRGNPVVTSEMVHVATGFLGFTQRHIYFHSPGKAFRIKYSKIVSFTPYSDGFGLQRDASTAKPQVFITGDGWFTYNLATNLARIDAA